MALSAKRVIHASISPLTKLAIPLFAMSTNLVSANSKSFDSVAEEAEAVFASVFSAVFELLQAKNNAEQAINPSNFFMIMIILVLKKIVTETLNFRQYQGEGWYNDLIRKNLIKIRTKTFKFRIFSSIVSGFSVPKNAEQHSAFLYYNRH